MVVKITPKFTKAEIDKILQGKVEAIHKAYFTYLQKIGDDFAARARKNDTYKDRTGNLRNSIGYIIFQDGEPYAENFEKTGKSDGKTKSKQDGTAVGRQKAIEFSKRYPKGWTLVCVAGMNYAAAVESKWFDVISGSSIEAKNDLIEAIASVKRIVDKI